MKTRKNPAARQSDNQVKNFEFQHSKSNPSSLAAQQLSKKFGLTPALAAIVAALAGVGPIEARTHGNL